MSFTNKPKNIDMLRFRDHSDEHRNDLIILMRLRLFKIIVSLIKSKLIYICNKKICWQFAEYMTVSL